SAARGGPSSFRLPCRSRRASRVPRAACGHRGRLHRVRPVTTRIAKGWGGPCRVRKTLRINGGNEIGRTVEQSLDEYFRKLDGAAPHGIYDMVINHVERALIATVMDRAGGNQTQAADMLGLNRNTLRAKLSKYHIRGRRRRRRLRSNPVAVTPAPLRSQVMSATVTQALLSVSDKTA